VFFLLARCLLSALQPLFPQLRMSCLPFRPLPPSISCGTTYGSRLVEYWTRPCYCALVHSKLRVPSLLPPAFPVPTRVKRKGPFFPSSPQWASSPFPVSDLGEDRHGWLWGKPSLRDVFDFQLLPSPFLPQPARVAIFPFTRVTGSGFHPLEDGSCFTRYFPSHL